MKISKKLLTIALTAIITTSSISAVSLQASAVQTDVVESEGIITSRNTSEQPTAFCEENTESVATQPTEATEPTQPTEPATALPTGSIVLAKKKLTMGVNETVKIKASLVDSNDATQAIEWTSSNESVLTVNNGKITAKKAGSAVITASLANGNYAECYVTIKNAPSKVSLNKTSLTLGIGETYDLNSKLPAGCGSYSIKYTSNNSAVATVKSSGGYVTAKKEGTAVITATTYNGKKVTCKITVKKAPNSVTLNKKSLTLGVGETYDLNSKLPKGTAAHSIVYSSSNSSVATVKSAGGFVTAKKVGTATITATTYNGKKVTCKITVKNAPTRVSLNKSSLSIANTSSSSFDLNSSLNSNSASHSIKYTSSNKKVATVKSSGGIVTPVSEGTATITATTYNGKTAKCTVTVTKGYTDDDLYCLAAVIWQEAGSTYCSDNLQLMVGNVVLNRVESDQFPDSIRGVITSKYAYGTMYWDGVSIPTATDPITESAIDRCYANAKKLLDGYRILPEDVVYQAGFVQGSGVYTVESGQYFCHM